VDEDMIELYNTTMGAINIGGWFLSDNKNDLTKYQIAAGTSIPGWGYRVFTEAANFSNPNDPGCHVPFAFSEWGDDAYLSSNAGGVAGGYREHVDFGATFNGVTVGLYVKSTGGTDFTMLETPTFGAAPEYPGAANSGPYIGPLVINEVMYHPADATAAELAAGYTTEDFEYVELYNRSATPQTLHDFYLGSGAGFTFGWCAGANGESWTLEPGATSTWTTSDLQDADYEVLVRYDLLDFKGQKRDLDDMAQYKITHAGGNMLLAIDQDDDTYTYTDPAGWVSLGTYHFNGTGTVQLTRGVDGAADVTVADEVKFKKAGHEVTVSSHTLNSPWMQSGPPALAPGAYLVLVKNYAAFDSRYHVVANNIPVGGVYSGNLGNGGDAIKLFQAGNPESNGYVPFNRIDYVNYGDLDPWPPEADGYGRALNRIDVGQYGNDPINW
jgi:hypothetical protein